MANDDKFKEWFIPGADKFDELFEKTKGLARYYYEFFADKEDQAFEGWFEDLQARASFYYYNASFKLNQNIPTVIFTVIVLVVLFYFRRQVMEFCFRIIKWILKLFQPKPSRYRADPYGSSRFSDLRDYVPTPDNPTPSGSFESGVFFGQVKIPKTKVKDEKGKTHIITEGPLLYSTPESHVLIAAPTRTGKGTSIIVPTLLKYQNSVFCIDPKGQNAAITAEWRQRTLGQQVHIINPWGLLPDDIKIPSSRINPLDLIRVDDRNAVSLAGFLVDFLMLPNPGSNDQFWEESAKTVLTGLILYTVGYEPDKATLGNVRRLVTLPEKKFEEVAVTMAASELFGGTLAEAGGTILDLEGNTRASIMATARANTAFLSDPVVKESLSHSDIGFDTLKQQQATVFIVIPGDMISTQGRWLRLMVGIGLTAFERGGRYKNRCLFLIDEFAALGQMKKIESGIATLSGYGVDMALVCQDLGQLKKHYGEDGRSSLMANCRDKYFCNIGDKETADLVSAMMGSGTIKVESHSESSGPGGEGSSTTTSSTGRRLEMPEELLQKGKEIGYVIRTGSHPTVVEPRHYYNDPVTAMLSNFDPYNQSASSPVTRAEATD